MTDPTGDQPEHTKSVGGAHGGSGLVVCATLALVLLTVIVWVIRITGVPDLIDGDQTRPSQYVMDVVVNGSWAVQRDFAGAIASKPPLTVWIGALASLTVDDARVQRWAVTLPGLLGVAGIVVLVVVQGQRWFGGHAGVWGAFGVLFSISGEKIVALVRTDGFFAFTVALAGLAAWHSWRTGRGWVWFWLAGAMATLTKGPLGLVLGGMGMLAILWERNRVNRQGAAGAGCSGRRMLLEHGIGIAAFLLISGGWFLLAWQAGGQAFIDKVIGDELVGHAIESGKGDAPFVNFYKAPAYMLWYYAPLSIFAVIGLVRTVRRPAQEDDRRRLERFLWMWLVGGLTIFAIAPHQRADLLAPLWFPMAMLGGREVDRILRGVTSGRQWLALGVLGVGLIGGSIAYRHFAVADERLLVAESDLRAAAADWEGGKFSDTPMVHTTDHAMFRLHLGRYRFSMEFEAAVEALASGEARLVAVSTGREDLERMLEEAGMSWELVAFYDTVTARHRIWILRITERGGDGEP